MENFVVSARKYRPATFDSVVGQTPITTTLKNAIKNKHLAQAFLFCGPRGVGKTTCARILAKTINCENVSDNIEACDKCESCTSFNQSHSFNIHELDAASNNGVDDIRNLIEQVRIAPQVGKYSIYIIDEVHMLSLPAFNAFLKTLEEPPAHAIFILATTSKQKIIPTILSRCQIFDFSRIQVRDIAKHLEFVAKSEEVTAESDALHIIAQKADGSLRDALSIFYQLVSFAGNDITYDMVIENLNILDYDYYFKITRFINERDISKCLLEFNEILNKGFDGHNFITGLGEHFRNLLVCKDVSTLELLQVGSNIKDKYKEQSIECSQEFLLAALNIVNKFDIQYKISINARLHVELALMRLCSMDSYFYFTQKPAATAQPEVRKDTRPETPDPTQSVGKSVSAVRLSAQAEADSTEAQPTDTSPIKEEGATYSAPETKQSVSETDTKPMSRKSEIALKESSGETPGSETPKPQTPNPEPRHEYRGQLKPQTISIYQSVRLPDRQVGEQTAEEYTKTSPTPALPKGEGALALRPLLLVCQVHHERFLLILGFFFINCHLGIGPTIWS